MIGIDTNLLVRYLTGDDAKQAAAVRRLLDGCREDRTAVLVSELVLCETCWVLSSVYGVPKSDILDTIEELLSSDVFTVSSPEAVESALRQARQHQGEFADHLIGAIYLARGCTETMTFDRKLSKSPGFVILR